MSTIAGAAGFGRFWLGWFTSAGGTTVNHIAKLDGAGWQSLGLGLNGSGIPALTVFDDGTGPALFVGGQFNVPGQTGSVSVAKWDGNSWFDVGGGLRGGVVQGFAIFDDGSGSALYAAGGGGPITTGVAKWDGSTWSALGSGLDMGASCLAVFDDGTGPALYVGGNFGMAGGLAASSVARQCELMLWRRWRSLKGHRFERRVEPDFESDIRP